jgi:hypothetical protein
LIRRLPSMTPLAVKLVQRCGTARSLQAESALRMVPYV